MFQICHLQGLCSNLRVYWQASSGQNLNEKINPDNCTNVTGNVQCLCTVSRPRDHHHSDTIVTLPRHSAHTVPTPPPRCSDPLSHHPHAAPLQPPCRLHAAAHCPHDAPPPPSPYTPRRNAALAAALTPLHAALAPPSSHLHAAREQARPATAKNGGNWKKYT